MKKLFSPILEKSKNYCKESRICAFFRPVFEAGENFFLKDMATTEGPPHIRDAVDIKRWMFLVIYALLPCIFMAIWNTGVQKYVYGSGNRELMSEFVDSCRSLGGYLGFVTKEGRFLSILSNGLGVFLPVMFVSYLAGGLVEVIFACVRKKPIEEGLLVTAMLFALILPPTIPLWMVAFGASAGIIFGKELFGGTGMNIVNPALACRIILFFSFPIQMAGDIWVGKSTYDVKKSLQEINREIPSVDAYTQATCLARYNIPNTICRLDVDAIAMNFQHEVSPQIKTVLDPLFEKYAVRYGILQKFGNLSMPILQGFVTSSVDEGGLGLSSENFVKAKQFADLEYGEGNLTNGNLFLGNRLGSMGETCVFGALLGAVILVASGVGSLSTMLSVIFGAFSTALIINLFVHFFTPYQGAFLSASLSFPAYKHLLIGGLAFGAVFMATDPVSSPTLREAKIVYGLLIGFLTIMIRIFNPAYPEGVMLAIFFGNICAPALDQSIAAYKRRGRYVAGE
jgi:Na+-transporting NADH:ubiquinone oxidoreductase subunit B